MIILAYLSVSRKPFEALSVGHEHIHLKGALLGYVAALEAIIILGCMGLHATNRLAILSVPRKLVVSFSIVQENARLKGAPLGYASFLVANVRLGYNKLHKMNTLAY
jgi:hypothetical protein